MEFGKPTHTLGQTLWLLSPELALLLAGVLITIGSSAFQHLREKRRWSSYVALAGLATSLIATITLWNCHTKVFFVLSCDPFALIIKAIALVATGLVVLISNVHLNLHQLEDKFYALLLFTTLAICLSSGATNLVMVFLAAESLNLATCFLIRLPQEDQNATEASIKYFFHSTALSAVMLYGMSWFYGLTSSSDLGTIARALIEMESSMRLVALPAMILIAAGLAFRVAAAPFHQWAPDVYEGAPTPMTAYLSVGPQIAGFAVIVRIFMTLIPQGLVELTMDWRSLLMALGVVTMTIGNLVALWQDNIKRLLAYSSIAQAGYILIGAVAASPRGLTAMLLFLIAYVLANLGAFAAVIIFAKHTNSYTIEDYAGVSDQAPAAALVLAICLLSLGGIPPTAGFMGKLWLFSAAIEEGLLWLAIIGVINNVISLAYYWKIIRTVYITSPSEIESREEHEQLATPPTLAIALGATAIGVLAVGILPGPILSLLQTAAPVFFGG